MVIGHHPHVTQGSEEYAGKSIHYSLGNFYMGNLFDYVSCSGSALEVVIDRNGLSSVVVPLRVSKGGINLDKSDEARDRYQNLCNKLTGEANYLQDIQTICDAHWAGIYARYYEAALTGLGTRPSLASAMRVLRRLAGICFKKRLHAEPNELLLLHNIQIESHRWVVQRALSKGI
jgi:poly-gamma-glutamate synthesis protein (capsule biosynthesis protein)